MTTVLVTGVGAIIGYGVLRSLRKSGRDLQLIGADIYSDAVGQAWSDKFVQAPLTSSDNYLCWLDEVISKYKVDLLIPAIEQDVHFLSEHRDSFSRKSVVIALNNRRLIGLSWDKWLMHQELARIDSKVRIPSFIEGSFTSLSKNLGLPFILKPRCSYASKGLVRVRCEADFACFANKLGQDLMAQPIIGTDEEEYTVAVFCDGQGQVCASITFKRRLAADGSTAKAWVRHYDELDEVVAVLCSHFKPVGPTNLQFRKDGKEWKLLEINPRISSTTSLRTAFGYNESEMCLRFYLEGKEIMQPVIKNGFAARYIDDFVIYDRDHF